MQNIGRSKSIWFACCIMPMLITLEAGATTHETPESSAISFLPVIIRSYSEENQGALPESWDQIRSVYDISNMNRNLVGRDSYPLETHYQFFKRGELPLPDDAGGCVLMLRTVPLGNTNRSFFAPKKLKRYVVYLREDGEILMESLPEEKVQKMLRQAGITVAPDPSLSAIEYDGALDGRKTGNALAIILVFVSAIALGLRWLLLKRRRFSAENLSPIPSDSAS